MTSTMTDCPDTPTTQAVRRDRCRPEAATLFRPHPDVGSPAELIERARVTGLRNGRGLSVAMLAEQQRCRMLGRKAAMVVVDLLDAPEGPGSPSAVLTSASGPMPRQQTSCGLAADPDPRDAWVRVAEIFTGASHACDVAARLEGGRFVILAVESDLRLGTALGTRLRRELRGGGLHAHLGIAARLVGETMNYTLQRATTYPTLRTCTRHRAHPRSLPLSVAAGATLSGDCDTELPQ